jgi:hypothetical protein
VYSFFHSIYFSHCIWIMKQMISFLLCVTSAALMLAPVADASVRVRNTTRSTYQMPVRYWTPPATTIPTNSYSFSPNYISGYTYYSSPTPGYYLYTSGPVSYTTSVSHGQYYYSQNYVAGYTYYSSPTPGYYYYLTTTTPYISSYQAQNQNQNLICTIINNVYQCTQNVYGPMYSTYPGCSQADIVIGGQIWASCNTLDRNKGSVEKSGWFFAGDVQSTFTSSNTANATLEWMGKQTMTSAWTTGPCASGYRLPTRGEWETLQSYARANSRSISDMIGLKQNGAYQASRNSAGDITITGRIPVSAGYWTSTMDNGTPTVMHIGSTYGGYRTDGTDYGYVSSGYNWTYTDTGLQLLRSTVGELANVRCVRQ